MKEPKHGNSLTIPDITKAVFFAVGAVIFLFLLFEVIEMIWLQNVEMATMHKIYLVRGLVISLTAILIVGWLLVKTSKPLLTTQKWSHGDRPVLNERLANFVNWFILMRWMAIVVATVLVYIVVEVNEWLPGEVWWPLIITISVLAILNSFYIVAARHESMHSYLLAFQAYADLIILTILLHFSGGIENPLTLMLLIHVFIAGIVLNQKHLYGVTTTAILLLIIMAVGEATHLFEHYTLNVFPHFEQEGSHIHAAHQPLYVVSHVGLMVTIFLLASYFIGTIMNRIRHDERQLEQFADQSLEQRQLIEKALATTGTGLCVCDNKGNPFWTNSIWETWFGPNSIDKVQSEGGAALASTLEDGYTRSTEITLDSDSTEEDRQSKTFLITTAPLYDKDNQIDHAVSLAKDITDQKEAQQQMLRAGKLAAVGELAGKVAHEVNNPIAILSAKCRLLLSNHKEEMSEKVSEELVKITDAADRVSDIAKGLLSYCRPSPSTRREMDISNSINNALSMVEQSAERKKVNIKNKMPDELPIIEANADEMQQVFLNLFLNALDAMPDGGTLELRTERNKNSGLSVNGSLVLQVRDSGVGIPDDIADQIFEPFFTTKDEEKGTGLGLSICAGLIRSHGGLIDVDSEPGEGTTFTIELPVGKTGGEDS